MTKVPLIVNSGTHCFTCDPCVEILFFDGVPDLFDYFVVHLPLSLLVDNNSTRENRQYFLSPLVFISDSFSLCVVVVLTNQDPLTGGDHFTTSFSVSSL